MVKSLFKLAYHASIWKQLETCQNQCHVIIIAVCLMCLIPITSTWRILWDWEFYYIFFSLVKPSFKKIKKIMENYIIGLTPPPPPFLAKIMENFEKYKLLYGLKKWSSIEINCIFLNYGIWHRWPPPYQLWNFP